MSKIEVMSEDLANKIGVTEKAISRWETGRGTPDISLLIPLSKELKKIKKLEKSVWNGGHRKFLVSPIEPKHNILCKIFSKNAKYCGFGY